MATIDCTAAPAVHQPLPAVPRVAYDQRFSSYPTTVPLFPQPLAAHMDHCLMVINIAERLPILSEDLLKAVPEGYLRQRMAVLHNNLVELAALAAQAKMVPLPPRTT